MVVGFSLMGGLGNNLFQIMVTIAYAKRYSFGPVFSASQSRFADVVMLSTHYSELFEHPIDFSFAPGKLPVYREPYFHYSPIPLYPNGAELQGYFQSSRYWGRDRDFALQTFSISEFLSLLIEQEFSDWSFNDFVAVHIRRGDYLQFQQYHPVQDMSYYNGAMELFPGRNFLIFSDDIGWCKSAFKGNNIAFMDKRLDSPIGRYIDLFLMSMCSDHIIANSTFSWWGAYLSRSGGKVVAPRHWFGEGYVQHNTVDLYEPEWEIL